MATVEPDSAVPGGSGTRRYRSPLRRMQAAQARAVVLEAATRLFAERGWAGTGVRDIARAAEVSVETVYATFGSKADLLKAALEVAIVGDDAQVPLADRPVYTAIGTGRTTGDRIESGARLIATINERTHRWPWQSARVRRPMPRSQRWPPTWRGSAGARSPTSQT